MTVFHLIGRCWQLGYPHRAQYGFWRRSGTWIWAICAARILSGIEVGTSGAPYGLVLGYELPSYSLLFLVYWEWRKERHNQLPSLLVLCSMLWAGCQLGWWWTGGAWGGFEWLAGISWLSLLLGLRWTYSDPFHESGS